MSQTEEVKKRIIEWCNEEGFEPEIQPDSDVRFNIKVKVGNIFVQIVQRASPNSFFVATKLSLTSEQYTRLESMQRGQRDQLVWELYFLLATNPSILDFNIAPKVPDQIREVFISSKPIFYDALSKDKLMSRVFDVHKAFTIVASKITRTIGGSSPSGTPSPIYI